MTRTRFTRWRRWAQFAVSLFYIGLPVMHRWGLHGVEGNLASLRIGPVDLTEPAAALSVALAGLSWSWNLWVGVLPVVLMTLILGPVFCSWVCPWGLLSEGIDAMRQRRRRRGAPKGTRSLPVPRAVLLMALLVTSVVLATPLVAVLSAPRLISSLPAQLIDQGRAPLTGLLLLGLLLVELAGPRRIWCRLLCPVGTMADLLRVRQTLHLRFAAADCLCPGRPPCQQRCSLGIDPRHMRRYDGCTNCLACIDHCPTGALHFGSPDGILSPRPQQGS